MDRSTARLRYAQHKASAAKRGIEWEFTFEEWWEIWEAHWADRGPHKDGKVMCRTHDKGPYRPDNVRIDSPRGNAVEAALMKKCSRPQWFASDPASGRGRGRVISEFGFLSDGNFFQRPDFALQDAQKEYEWIPGE